MPGSLNVACLPLMWRDLTLGKLLGQISFQGESMFCDNDIFKALCLTEVDCFTPQSPIQLHTQQ
jgi:hypothetical protein